MLYIYYHIFTLNKHLIPYQPAVILAPTDSIKFSILISTHYPKHLITLLCIVLSLNVKMCL